MKKKKYWAVVVVIVVVVGEGLTFDRCSGVGYNAMESGL